MQRFGTLDPPPKPKHLTNNEAAYNLIIPLSSQFELQYMSTLQYFRVNFPMVLDYVLDMWPTLAATDDNVAYEYVIESVTNGHSIFACPEDFSSSNVFFYHTEQLMECIYRIRDQLRYPLNGRLDTSNEYDETVLSCRARIQDAVVIFIQPELKT
jgi:hypothetical protein